MKISLKKIAAIFLILFICFHCKANDKKSPIYKFKKSKKNFSTGFDFPVGRPNARGYYNAQRFGNKNPLFKGFHLGEDWNGIGGGNSDMGDNIYSISEGIVFYSGNPGPGWGNVIRIMHKIKKRNELIYIESLYAHLLKINVTVGKIVKRGELIGTMGNAGGRWLAHLHFEIRNKNLPIGGGYSSKIPKGYLAPTPFIKKNR